MRVIDARWTPAVNMLLLECSCGYKFEVTASKRYVRCKKCNKQVDLLNLKLGGQNYV